MLQVPQIKFTNLLQAWNEVRCITIERRKYSRHCRRAVRIPRVVRLPQNPCKMYSDTLKLADIALKAFQRTGVPSSVSDDTWHQIGPNIDAATCYDRVGSANTNRVQYKSWSTRPPFHTSLGRGPLQGHNLVNLTIKDTWTSPGTRWVVINTPHKDNKSLILSSIISFILRKWSIIDISLCLQIHNWYFLIS